MESITLTRCPVTGGWTGVATDQDGLKVPFQGDTISLFVGHREQPQCFTYLDGPMISQEFLDVYHGEQTGVFIFGAKQKTRPDFFHNHGDKPFLDIVAGRVDGFIVVFSAKSPEVK